MDLRLVSSPGTAYAEEIRGALTAATSFVLVSAFASQRGFDVVEAPLHAVLERGGSGRIYLAVDRAGFNTAQVFETLLNWRDRYPNHLSVALVLQERGLMHAKALFTKGPHGPQLIVGSANLTRSALSSNYELGVFLARPPEELQSAFVHFVNKLPARQLDGPDAREYLAKKGLIERSSQPPTPAGPRSAGESNADSLPIFMRLGPPPPLDEADHEYLLRWIERGYLVGRGRRNVDALVLRLPNESLVQRNVLLLPRPGRLGAATRETTSKGFGIDLVPTNDAELLRRDARRVTDLTSRLTLNLPCFGRWMPASYWETFEEALQTLSGADALSPARIRDVAASHRSDLLAGGLEREIDVIVERLAKLELLVPGKGDALRRELLERFRRELTLRTPDVIASCVDFRVARQRWSPIENTDVPFRQLMVDIVQATFSATYRTGDWPRRFRSFPAGQLAAAMAARLAGVGRNADGETATTVLDGVTSWERPETPFERVVDEFRRLAGDDLDFPPPDVKALTGINDDGSEESE